MSETWNCFEMKKYFPSLGFAIFIAILLLSMIPLIYLISWIENRPPDTNPIALLVFILPVVIWLVIYTWNARLELSYDKLVMYDSFMRKHTISAKTHSLDGIEGPDVPVLRNRGDRFIYFRPRNNPKKRLKVNLSIQKPEGYHAVHKWIEDNYARQP